MAELPEPIRFGVHLLEVLAPAAAYRTDRDGFAHRAEKAAHHLIYGRETDVVRLGPGVYRVRSESRAREWHDVDLEYTLCDCEDRVARQILCWHVLAAAMAETIARLADDDREAAMTEREAAQAIAELWGP